MATEDFTTFTEVDPDSDITVTAVKVSWVQLPANVDSYVYKDKGVDHFSGDYEHLLEVCLDAANNGWHNHWALANAVGTYSAIEAANGDEHTYLAGDYTGTKYARIQELVAGTVYLDQWYPSLDTIYYLKIKRDEAVGTYGTLYCYIYDDAERTSLVDTLTLTLHEKEDFRYIYGVQGYNWGDSWWESGWTENLDLQEALTIIPTGIASSEAFGTATLTTGAVTILPTAIASAEAIGAPIIQPGAVTLLPTAIVSLEAFGTATISPGAVTIQPSTINSAEAFGTLVIILGAVYIQPGGIASLEAFGTPTVSNVGVLFIYPTSIESAETFGTAKITIERLHAILEAHYLALIQEANRAQVFGDGVLTEDWDWDEIELVYDQLAQANDLNLDTTTKAHQRGEAILRNYQLSTLNGSILVPMNCGQDLYDVIAITSSQAGLDASRRRVLALSHTWTPKKGKYTLKLKLGAP